MQIKHNSSYIILPVIIFFLLLLSSCQMIRPVEKKSITGYYFDTVITMTVYTNDNDLLGEALSLCGEYERMMSKTVESSDVWNINHAGGKRIAVSDDTRAVIEKALYYSEQTNGAFDISIAPAVDLWDFNSDSPVLPDPLELKKAAGLIDYKKIDINEQGVLIPSDMSIDLGGIAKGYITDRVADFLKTKGVTSGVLNFGGNVFTIGLKPDGKKWIIGIKDPQDPDGTVMGSVETEDKSVVTSGIYERGFTLSGIRYHHLLDTGTGWPIENGLAAVTVICDNSDDADALSTSCFALGLDEGIKYIETLKDTEAVFITSAGETYTSSGLTGLYKAEKK